MVQKKSSLFTLIDSSEYSWLQTNSPNHSIWKITFQNKKHVNKEISSTESNWKGIKVIEQNKRQTRIALVWEILLPDKKISTVTADARFESKNSFSYWSIQIQVPEGWKIIHFEFPVLSNLKTGKNHRVAVPLGWGLEYELKPELEYEGKYPSCLAGMQFVAFYWKRMGLYIGAHDTQANQKTFQIKPIQKKLEFSVIHYPEIPARNGYIYQMPYEMVLVEFEGDYLEAAQIYRKFTYQTPWGNLKPIAKRKIPKWIHETDLWLRPDGSAEENLDITKKALKYFDVPISLHWYRWHKIPYDTLYPEYFPTLDGFSEAIQELQKEGTHIIPYINGRLWDPVTKSWKTDKGYNYAAKDEKGDFYTEIYGSKVPLHVMCPYTRLWQKKVKDLVERLIRECHVDGVYIDQIGAAYPVQCFNPNHGHPIGGGHFWYDGYRKMLNEIRKNLHQNIILTTEENAEPWLDQFEAQLLVNTHNRVGEPIPLFPAVYSDRVITHGFMYFPEDDLKRSLPFRLKMARAFLWGSQLGWIQPAKIMSPEYDKEAAYLRNLARCRRFAHDYFTNGRFCGLIDIQGENPRLRGKATASFGGNYRIDIPSVIGSLWISNKGSIGIPLVNQSNENHKVKISLYDVQWQISKKNKSVLEIYDSEGLKSRKALSKNICAVEIPSLSALLLILK